MSDMSDYMEQSSYDFWFRPGVAAPTRPTGHEVSLWSVVIDEEEAVGTELTAITAPGYARASATFGAPDDGVGTNTNLVQWPLATADWIPATHYGIHDHLGNPLQRLKALPSPITVVNGTRASAQPGDLQIAFD